MSGSVSVCACGYNIHIHINSSRRAHLHTPTKSLIFGWISKPQRAEFGPPAVDRGHAIWVDYVVHTNEKYVMYVDTAIILHRTVRRRTGARAFSVRTLNELDAHNKVTSFVRDGRTVGQTELLHCFLRHTFATAHWKLFFVDAWQRNLASLF